MKVGQGVMVSLARALIGQGVLMMLMRFLIHSEQLKPPPT